MQKTINELSSVLLDRFKNPYVVTFLISWTLFNWKPIIFFIFSKGTVEYKIDTIQIYYSDIEHYFCYPLISTLLFLFALPYLNTLNEYCVQWTLEKRGKFATTQIKNKIKENEILAIAEHEKNEAIRIVKEGKNRDEFIEKIEKNYLTIEKELQQQIFLNLEQNSRHNKELKSLSDKFNNEIKEQTTNYEKLQKTNSDLRIRMLTNDKEINRLNESNSHISTESIKLKQLIKNLEKEKSIIENKHIALTNQFEITHTTLVNYQNRYGNI
ncbi:hypothetical protein D1631_16280 [Chryseobacterium nematophagum]|uniref:Uncharacterized protein n=1 Tax=Chryseobacterium nematophagum TaxID=2305228 RepID=A0A3M7TJB5_9FLAO|nr:hypothetical protein [Chryseobacterium nematophagum]RNA63368.1 hypothetical protein D1631_16280 [Chryseobacterium nematophagum]